MPFCFKYIYIRFKKQNATSRYFYYFRSLFRIQLHVNLKSWAAKQLVLFNHTFTENAMLFPKTFQLILLLPGFCRAMLSLMQPSYYLPLNKEIYLGISRVIPFKSKERC